MSFKFVQKVRKVAISSYTAALCRICYLLIASAAESAFVYPLAISIITMLGSLFDKEKEV